MLASTVLKPPHPQPLPATRCARGGRGEDPSWTRNAAKAERPVARRATHLRHCQRRYAIGLPAPANQCAIAAETACAKKLILQAASNGSTPVQPCREKYFSFGFSEIDVS
jgi:hypothetical protein